MPSSRGVCADPLLPRWSLPWETTVRRLLTRIEGAASVYVGSKHAVEVITKSVALEVAVDCGISMCQCKVGMVEEGRVGGGLRSATPSCESAPTTTPAPSSAPTPRSTTSAPPACCAPSPRCCATTAGSSSWRARWAPCTTWRPCCTTASTACRRWTRWTRRSWRDAVKDGSAWPGFVNIPSKIGQVAAVRALAEQRREQDLTSGILLAAVCPGMMNTPTSGMWWDVSDAPSPAEAAVALLDLAFDAVNADHYGRLVRNGNVLPWAPGR